MHSLTAIAVAGKDHGQERQALHSGRISLSLSRNLLLHEIV